MTLEEMTAQRDALLAARYRGLRTVEIDGRRVTYATDAEMAAAIADLERRIALAGKRWPPSPDSDVRFERALNAGVADASPTPRRGVHRRLRGGTGESPAQGLPAEPGASQHADRGGRSRHHGARPLARAQQRLCRQRDRELGRQCGRRRHQAVVADRGCRAQSRRCRSSGSTGPTRPTPKGFTDFYGLQRRAAREVFIAGEVFFRFRPRRPQDGLTVPLQLQMLPSEMLPLNRNEVSPGGNVIRQGIEFDAIGRRVAYHFLRRHPGDMTDPGLAGEIVRVPASEIVHVIDPVDAGQLRGVSRFAAGIVKLFLLDQYDDAELDRKKVAAMHALFITTPAPAEPLDAAEGRDENDERTLDLQPGQITMLEPGEEVQTSAPADSGQTYEPFQYRTLLQVSAALGVPYAYLSNDMLKANYSNSRLALLEFRRRIEAYQHAVIVWQLCRQVWARWMDTAVLAGALDLPDYDQRRREYLACGWLPPKWDWVDPLKDARAEIEQIEAGLKSRTPGARRARLRRRAGRCRDRRRQGAGEVTRLELRIGFGCGNRTGRIRRSGSEPWSSLGRLLRLDEREAFDGRPCRAPGGCSLTSRSRHHQAGSVRPNFHVRSIALNAAGDLLSSSTVHRARDRQS